MSRKVLISVLGTGNYSPCIYHKDKFQSSNTRFVQHAVIEHIGADRWSADDQIYILLTDRARKSNWENKIDKDTKKEINGFRQVLQSMHLPCGVESISICNGMDESEIWSIFQTLYQLIHEEDEVYLDLTHGFRYLPMLVLVFSNYAKFLKHISVKYMSYGNFEASTKTDMGIFAPLVDLVPLTQLQDWTFASADFLKNGNAHFLNRLCQETIGAMFRQKPDKELQNELKEMNHFGRALEELTDVMRLCRGKMIQDSDKWEYLQKMAEQVKSSVIPPIAPLLAKIQNSFASFIPHKDIRNGYHAFIWCYDHGLYQQAITILLETMISQYAQILGLDWRVKENRLLVSSVINVQNPNRGIKGDHTETPDAYDTEEEDNARLLQLVEQLSADNFFQQTSAMYWELTIYRNDINHSGLLENASKSDKLISKIRNYTAFLKTIIE